MSRKQYRKIKSKRGFDRLTFWLLIAFAIIAIVTGALGFIFIRNIVNSWTMTSLPGIPQEGPDGEPIQFDPNDPAYLEPLQAASGPTPEPWDGASRVNILIMGLDYRDWEAGETPRTDTMIIFTIDPLSKTAGLFSIPRDMWVSIPGFDHGKINTAYYLGETYNVPGGGPGLAMETVEHFLGVPINYYAQIDFKAFVDFIDELGGLDIHIYDDITVDPIGPGNTVKLREGVQCLDGATILGYARTRYTDGGDFDRSKRQQHVIMAIREQILTWNMLPELIAKSPALYQKLSQGVRTNLSLQQTVQLALLAQDIPAKNIAQVVIPPDVVYQGMSPDGLSIIIPIPDEIRLLRDQVFTTGGPVGRTAEEADLLSSAQAEQARISIQNGTQTPGLASRTAEYLRSQGLNIVEETNADQVYNTTTIIIYDGTPYTIDYLATLMSVPTSHIYNRYEPDTHADVVVIIGNNWANNNPMP